MEYNVTLKGSLISLAAGSSIFLGFHMMNLYTVYAQKETLKKEQILHMSVISMLAGGLTSFGLYTFVPNRVRCLWV